MVRQGVTSFKVYTAYKRDMGINDDWILRILQKCAQENALLNVHCESGEMIEVLESQFLERGKTDPIYLALSRPPVTESESTHRVIELARLARAPVYIVHLSAREALAEVMAARDQGQMVFSETCPHYLFLTQAEYERADFEGSKFACAPPLREPDHQEALWNGLRSGAIQVVASDHCTFNFGVQRQLGRHDFTKIPLGVPDIETRLYLLWDGGVRTGKISPNRFVDLTATTPASLFGLFPVKGTIAVGSDADIVIWEPDREFTLSQASMHSNMDYCMYEGRSVRGAPLMVFSRGELIVEQNHFLGRAGDGHFLKRRPFG
jgi:dihydropyrimidinase